MNMLIEIVDGVAYVFDEDTERVFSCDECALNGVVLCTDTKLCDTDLDGHYRHLTGEERQQVIAALGRGIK